MQPNNVIDPLLLNNESEFTAPFFKQFSLRTNKKPLMLSEDIAKDYLFPTFYGNTSCSIGIFLCDYNEAKKLLPHKDMNPVAMPKGRALVIFSCYEYRKVLGVAPYNEIAMTIPVLIDPKVNVPVLPLLAEKLFSNFGYYVFHMPVTSLENQIRGREIWGLPKVVDTIDITKTDNISQTTATDSWGNEYFSLKVPTNGKPTEFDVKSNLYSVLNNQLLQSSTQFKSTFNVIKNISTLWSNNQQDSGVLTIGTGPYGDMLRKLKIEPKAFQFRYTNNMNACFDLPNTDYQAPFTFSR